LVIAIVFATLIGPVLAVLVTRHIDDVIALDLPIDFASAAGRDRDGRDDRACNSSSSTNQPGLDSPLRKHPSNSGPCRWNAENQQHEPQSDIQFAKKYTILGTAISTGRAFLWLMTKRPINRLMAAQSPSLK
jgi:hypothetical protein